MQRLKLLLQLKSDLSNAATLSRSLMEKKFSMVCSTLVTGHSSPEAHWTNMPVMGKFCETVEMKQH